MQDQPDISAAPAQGQPVIGHAGMAPSPFAQTILDNSPRFTVSPSLRGLYESNAIHAAARPGEGVDNYRLTPGLDIVAKHHFGKTTASLDGTAGYDLNSRFTALNNLRLAVNGNLDIQATERCRVTLSAGYKYSQYDLVDLLNAQKWTLRDQSYGAQANCAASFGLEPSLGATYHTLGSNHGPTYNFKQYLFNAGVSYSRPSLGTVTVSGSLNQLRRPQVIEVFGLRDGTNVYTTFLRLDRHVSPRLQANAAVGYVIADPQRLGVGKFTGVDYDATLIWRPKPRLSIIGTALRTITNDVAYNATYILRDAYRGELDYDLSARSRLVISGGEVRRRFRGEGLVARLPIVGSDRTDDVSLDYRYRLTRSLHLGLGYGHRWRKAENRIYDYSSHTVSLSVGAAF